MAAGPRRGRVQRSAALAASGRRAGPRQAGHATACPGNPPHAAIAQPVEQIALGFCRLARHGTGELDGPPLHDPVAGRRLFDFQSLRLHRARCLASRSTCSHALRAHPAPLPPHLHHQAAVPRARSPQTSICPVVSPRLSRGVRSSRLRSREAQVRAPGTDECPVAEAARPSVAQRISLGLRRLPPRPLRGQPRAAPRETAARSSVRPTVRGWLRSVEMRPATDVGSCASPSWRRIVAWSK